MFEELVQILYSCCGHFFEEYDVTETKPAVYEYL